MKPNEPPLKVGDIVQLSPMEGNGGPEWFGGCLMVVTEPKPWGAQGYVESAGSAGQAYFRAKWEYMEPTGGKAVWMPDRGEDDGK